MERYVDAGTLNLRPCYPGLLQAVKILKKKRCLWEVIPKLNFEANFSFAFLSVISFRLEKGLALRFWSDLLSLWRIQRAARQMFVALWRVAVGNAFGVSLSLLIRVTDPLFFMLVTENIQRNQVKVFCRSDELATRRFQTKKLNANAHRFKPNRSRSL